MPLTVVQTLPALESGGVERGTLEVARALVQAGHRSIVVAAGGRLAGPLLETGSEHIDWPIGAKTPLTLRFVSKLRRLLRAEGVDILHARSRLPAWIGYLAWRGMPAGQRPRFLTTVHGVHGVNRYSRIMTRGERVIAISGYLREHILRHYPGVDARSVRVIPRGVDPAQYPYGYRPSRQWLAEWRAQFPRLADMQLVTLPARLTRRKGQADLIAIMTALRNCNDLHGLIVGGARPRQKNYAAELQRLVHAAGLGSRVTLLGHRDDVREIMAISSVVLSLSRRPEAFGRTVIEALSLGVPVIGYNHGGVAEIMRALCPAGLVVPGDVEAAAARLQEFIHNPPAVPREHRYTLARMLDDTLALYSEMAAE